MRAPLVLVSVTMIIAACSGGVGDEPGDDSATEGPVDDVAAQVTTTVISSIDTVVAADGDALDAGPGDESHRLSDVASNGADMLAIGSHVDGDDRRERPVVLYSADGRAWEAVSGSLGAQDEDTMLRAVVAVGDELVVAGEHGAQPAVWSFDDGTFSDPKPVDFGDGPGTAQVSQAVAAGSRLVLVGIRTDTPGGAFDPNDPPVVSVVVSSSDDLGETWTAVEMPEPLDPIDASGAMLESMASGNPDVDLLAAGLDDELVLAVRTPGDDSQVTTLWRLDPEAPGWTELGTVADLLDGERVNLLHAHGTSLLAFTSIDGDAAGWQSTDGGVSFQRMHTDPSVLGGDGRQVIVDALSLADGTLVVAGHTVDDSGGLQSTSELEIWSTRDLKSWERPIADSALGSTGAVRATGLGAMGDAAVVVGTHERTPTIEERDAYAGSVESGQPARPDLAQDVVAWIVEFEEQAVVPPSAMVAALDVSGIDDDATVSGLAAVDDALVAAGWISDDDDAVAMVWRSVDGESWEAIDAPVINEPMGQYIYGLTATSGGLIAVGRSVVDGTDLLGIWTSPDGVDWTRADLADAEFESATAYGVTETEDGLLAVGTSDSGRDDRYRSPGIWTSEDDGRTWASVDTTEDPFWQRNVEVLADVTVTPAGRVVAGGHTGDAEDREDGGFSYTPHAYAVESVDGGVTWTALDAPFGGGSWSDLERLFTVGDDVVASGTSGAVADGLPGEPMLSGSGVARLSGHEWIQDDRRYRHTPWIDDATTTPFGLVVTGRWSRNGGSDVLIGLMAGDEVNFLTEGLLAEGDQRASAAASLGDRVIVLGTHTVDDETSVVGWSVDQSQAP